MESIESHGPSLREAPAPAGPIQAPAGRSWAPDTGARLGSSRYGYTFRRFLLASDLLAMAVAMGAAAIVAIPTRYSDASELLGLALFVPMWLALASSVGLYHLAERRIDQSIVDEAPPTFLVTTVWIWLYEVGATIIGDRPYLLELGTVWLVAIVAVLGFRAIARKLARGRTWFRRTVALIGSEQDTAQVLRRIFRHPEWGLDPILAVRLDGDGDGRVDHLQGRSVRSREPFALSGHASVDARRVANLLKQAEVERAIVAGGSASLADRTELTRTLTERQVCVDYVSGEPESLYSSTTLHYLEGLPIMTIQPLRLWRGSAMMKRGIDIAIAGLGLAAFSPVLAYAAIRIKLDSPGPVIFRQARVGRYGREFSMLKFRTMVDGADEMRDEVRGLSIHGGEGMLKVPEDPRVTRFGAKLRRWSFDELPQLWNVVRGDMSLVGPRPLPVEEAGLVSGFFVERMRMRPGITGPWQTQGRSDIPFEDMIQLDYMYVAHWTMREDFRFLAHTLGAVTHGRGAY
jgi:exopolysaccharide biosynthesis polyprenyl glycosylphosphotransferase